MSKMNKAQVVHLETRLNKALRVAAQEKFKLLPQVLPSTLEIEKECRVIQKLLKMQGMPSYNLRNLAHERIKQKCPATPHNLEIVKAKDIYLAVKQGEIELIIDSAILGDSTEALEALKSFQEGL